MGLKKKKYNSQINMPEGGISLTSFMDVMIVLIFFLVKSMTVSSTNLNTPKGIHLPKVKAGQEAKQALVVSISAAEVWADYKPVMKLDHGDFLSKDIGEDGRTLEPLKAYLDKENSKRLAIYKGMGNLDFLPPGKILIQADHHLPFKLVKYLLHTAATSGYSDYKFVVVKDKDGG